MQKLSVVLSLLSLLIALNAHAQNTASDPKVSIDGVIGAEEWAGAIAFNDFVEVQPLTLAPAPAQFRTEAKLLSTPNGLAVAITADQAISVPRLNARVQRDFIDQVDRINFMVDFDADGRAAYDR